MAEAFYLTASIEKYGSGFIRIRQSLLDYPEVQFTVEELSGGLCLMFAKPAAEEGGGVNGGVNDPAALAALIAQYPGAKTASLVDLSQTPRRTVERWLKQLKVQGLIEFRGAPKTGGYHLRTGSTE